MRKPPRPCKRPGCPGVTQDPSGFCERHREQGLKAKAEHKRAMSKMYEARRPDRHARGYGVRWTKYRAYYLRQNPLCAECQRRGFIKEAKHVDHIQPVTGPNDPRFYDESNHQPLCHSCHSSKTLAETKRKR